MKFTKTYSLSVYVFRRLEGPVKKSNLKCEKQRLPIVPTIII